MDDLSTERSREEVADGGGREEKEGKEFALFACVKSELVKESFMRYACVHKACFRQDNEKNYHNSRGRSCTNEKKDTTHTCPRWNGK